MYSQTDKDYVAREIVTVLNIVETCTYNAKTSASATPVSHAITNGRFTEYSDHVTALHALVGEGQVRREDRRFRVPTADVSWIPTTYDEIVRADGTSWRVLAVNGGPGKPFYHMQVRKFGGPHG